MFLRFLGGLWGFLPGWLRRRTARLAQARFTVTVGAFIFDEQRRILLLDHVFRPDDGWGVPGGFIGKHEQPETALRRELQEEIGIEVEQVQLLFVRTLYAAQQIEIYFVAKAIGDPAPRSFEIKKAEWFSINKLPTTLSRDQRRIIDWATKILEKTFA